LNKLAQHYRDKGYVLCRQLIPHELIDHVLNEFNDNILPSKKYFFRQDTRFQTNKISNHGYLENPLMNLHCYKKTPNRDFSVFSECVRNILSSQEVRSVIEAFTGFSKHNLMQSMLFDLNTATPAHQDCYYLDSIPHGHLFAGWFALEDISEDAGRFYVLPNILSSTTIDLTDDEKIHNSSYIKKIKKHFDSNTDKLYVPSLKKGDVLFWNSFTIHGALETRDAKYSRKSLTAHYMPSHMGYGNIFAKIPKKINYGDHVGMRFKDIQVSPRGFTKVFWRELEHKLTHSPFSDAKTNWELRLRRRWGPKAWKAISAMLKRHRCAKR